jgi:type IV pilus assembly protein PilO
MALPSIDPQQRQKLLLGFALLAAVAYGGYSYVLGPRGEEIAALESRLETIQVQNASAKALTRDAGTGDVEQRLAIYREHLHSVEALIPSAEELPDLLDAISAEAQRSGVQLTFIQPVQATEEQYYTRRMYDIAVVGAFHPITQFLTRVASLPRIVTPLGLSLARQAGERPDDPRLEARFTIETYVLTPSDRIDVASR